MPAWTSIPVTSSSSIWSCPRLDGVHPDSAALEVLCFLGSEVLAFVRKALLPWRVPRWEPDLGDLRSLLAFVRITRGLQRLGHGTFDVGPDPELMKEATQATSNFAALVGRHIAIERFLSSVPASLTATSAARRHRLGGLRDRNVIAGLLRLRQETDSGGRAASERLAWLSQLMLASPLTRLLYFDLEPPVWALRSMELGSEGLFDHRLESGAAERWLGRVADSLFAAVLSRPPEEEQLERCMQELSRETRRRHKEQLEQQRWRLEHAIEDQWKARVLRLRAAIDANIELRLAFLERWFHHVLVASVPQLEDEWQKAHAGRSIDEPAQLVLGAACGRLAIELLSGKGDLKRLPEGDAKNLMGTIRALLALPDGRRETNNWSRLAEQPTPLPFRYAWGEAAASVPAIRIMESWLSWAESQVPAKAVSIEIEQEQDYE